MEAGVQPLKGWFSLVIRLVVKRGAISIVSMYLFTGVKVLSNWTDHVQCGFRQKFFSSLKGKTRRFSIFSIIPTFIAPNKSAPPRINREEAVSDTYLISKRIQSAAFLSLHVGFCNVTKILSGEYSVKKTLVCFRQEVAL